MVTSIREVPTQKCWSGRFLCNNILEDFTNLLGSFAVPGLKYCQIWSESRLMGPVWGRICSSETPSSTKSHQIAFFAGFFQPLLKVIENIFARDLGGIIQLCMGYRLGYEQSRRYGRGNSGAQLGHSTRASTTTELEWISIFMAGIACLWPSSSSCATKRNSRQPNQQFIGWFSDYDGRK